MPLQEILWDEGRECFVRREDSRKVLAFAIGQPKGFVLFNKNRDGYILPAEAIAQHRPKNANAFCTSSIRVPNPSDIVQETPYEVQYYQAFSAE